MRLHGHTLYHNGSFKFKFLVKFIIKAAILTTSVFVILASNSVRLSPHSERLVLFSCRPQIAAATLPVAIMDGGYMTKLKSEERAKPGIKICLEMNAKIHKSGILINKALSIRSVHSPLLMTAAQDNEGSLGLKRIWKAPPPPSLSSSHPLQIGPFSSSS